MGVYGPSMDACLGTSQITSGELLHFAMEDHHFSWGNPLFLWPCSIAMLAYQRVSG